MRKGSTLRKFLNNNLLILILLNSSNIFNYLFQLFVGRAMLPEDYGKFNALNSMAVILSAPVAVLPLVFSRQTIKLAQTSFSMVKALLSKSLRGILFISAGAFLIGTLAIPWFKEFLHLSTELPILIMLSYLSLSLISPIPLGVLQGLHRFLPFGLGISSISLVRFLAGMLFVLVLGWGVNGALLAGVTGMCMAIVISLWSVRDILKQPQESLPAGTFKELGKFSLPVFCSTTMLMAVGNLDIVLVRHYCSPDEAGLYSAAAVIGRIALYLPMALVAVLFPEVVKSQEKGEKGYHLVWITFGLTALIGGGFAFFCYLWPEITITILFGDKYLSSAPLLQVISISMAFLAMANVIFIYQLAHSNFGFLWPQFLGIILVLSLVISFHGSALTIAKAILVSVVVTLLGALIHFLILQRRHQKS
jgi:O-antigen/teichoic acid export membrane protein